MVPLTKCACPHNSNKLNMPHGSEYFTSPLGGRGVILAYLWGAADVIFTQQLVTCQCWSRPLQLVLLVQNFSDRSAQESSHVVLWCLWQIQTWMNGYFCLHLWRQRSLVLYLKERHYPSLMHWDYVANLMSDASHYWHWYPLCKLFINSLLCYTACCWENKVFYMESFCNDTILCSFSSCLLSPSFCHVLLLLMPTIHHDDFSKV